MKGYLSQRVYKIIKSLMSSETTIMCGPIRCSTCREHEEDTRDEYGEFIRLFCVDYGNKSKVV